MRVLCLFAVVAVALGAANVANAKIPPLYKSCSHLNAKYHHGIGKAHAKDHTTGSPPVTTFKRSDKLYKLAISYNRGLDRDHDGIACEKF